MFESVPTYPDAGRYWDMVQRHKITVFYTAPTAIRALMKFGDEYVTKYDRSSLKYLVVWVSPLILSHGCGIIAWLVILSAPLLTLTGKRKRAELLLHRFQEQLI